MMELIQKNINKLLLPIHDYQIGNLYFSPSYLQAGLVIVLLFLMVLTFARMRYLYVHWSLGKHGLSMIFLGFILAIIIEGFLVLSGRTLFTEIIGWKNAPKPITAVLDVARGRLVKVLGENTQIPSSLAGEQPTVSAIEKNIQELSESDRNKLKSLFCSPN